MRTEQEEQLKAMMNSALALVKNSTAFISSMSIDSESIKGLSEDQIRDLKKQTDMIKENTNAVEIEIEKLTKNDSKGK